MAPTSTTNGDALKDNTPSVASNGAAPTTKKSCSCPHTQTRDDKDILAYEDKWIGWDGPVWCSRYGRFETKDQARRDDGFVKDPVHAHHPNYLDDTSLHRCGYCAPRLWHEHPSYSLYVHDMQRRLEPIVASVVRLEHKVGDLLHKQWKAGERLAGKMHMTDKGPGGSSEDSDFEKVQNYDESPAETIQRLEAQIERLIGQIEGKKE